MAVIPAHLLYLIFSRELEVGLRLGPAYLTYKRNVPFLIPRRVT